MTRARRLHRSLYWLPLLVLAPLGGWMFLPSASGAAPVAPIAAPAASIAAPADSSAPTGTGGVSGQVLYQQNCASCHGEDGSGTARSQHVSLRGVGEASVDFMLSTGRMPRKSVTQALPPYRAILPEADVKALDFYVSRYISAGGPGIPAVNPDAGDPEKGGEYFREACAACHSWAGAGGVLYDREVPKITYATPTQVAEAIRIGPNQMPIFGPKQMDQDQLNDVVAYVTKNLEHPYDKGGDPMNHIGPVAEGFVILAIVLPLILMFTRWIGERG